MQEIIEQTCGPKESKVNYTQINYTKKITDFPFYNMAQKFKTPNVLFQKQYFEDTGGKINVT